MKKIPFLKLLNAILWSALLIGLVVVLGFVDKEQRQMACAKVEVRLEEETAHQLFINQEEIEKIISEGKGVPSLIGQPVSTFDVSELENDLELNPYVCNAEVFAEMDGTLCVEVEQRKPLVRIFKPFSSGYYIDEKGLKMPLSPRYSANVLVATGNIYERYEGKDSVYSAVCLQLYELADFISKNEFWRLQIDQIYVNEKSEFVLLPKVGNHKILLGSVENKEEKFRNLWLFYKKAISRVGWEKYKVINLKYTGQIVCEK